MPGQSGEGASRRVWTRGVVGALVVVTLVIVWRLVVVYRGISDGAAPTVDNRLAEGQLLIGVLTGLLTLVIAGATLWYAGLTRDLVRSGEEQVKVSRSQIELAQKQIGLFEQEVRVAQQQVDFGRASLIASSRALLVDVPWGVHTVRDNSRSIRFAGYANPVGINDRGKPFVPNRTSDHASLYAPIRNIGPGAAVITGVNVSSSPGVSWPGTMTPAIVPPTELSELVFSVPRDRPELSSLVDALDRRGPVSVYVSYSNAAGADSLRTRLDLVDAGEANHLRVGQVTIFETDALDTEPIVQSGPSGM